MVDPFPADRSTQWLRRCHQGQVALAGRWAAIKQNKIACHHMLVNSSADVVVEDAAKRLLPDMNLELKAKNAESIVVGVAKRLALVQADTWAKRGEAGNFYELDPLLREEEATNW